MREPNILLDALIDEAGMSHDGFASRVNQAGKRGGLVLLYDHASVRRWIRDATVPRGQVPDLICEILSARLGRTVTLADAGLDRYGPEDEGTPLTHAANAAVALWRSDHKQAASAHLVPSVQGPASIAPLYEWENPPDDLDVSRRIGPRVSREQVRGLQDAAMRINPNDEPPETSYVQTGLVETQHADALRTLGDLSAAFTYAQQSVDVASHSHSRGRVHRLATLAVVQAGQGDAEHAACTANQMIEMAVGMESRRIEERVLSVRDAITSRSDGRAAADFAERVADLTGLRNQ